MDIVVSVTVVVALELMNSILGVEPDERGAMMMSTVTAVGALGMVAAFAVISLIPDEAKAALPQWDITLAPFVSVPLGALGGFGAQVLRPR